MIHYRPIVISMAISFLAPGALALQPAAPVPASPVAAFQAARADSVEALLQEQLAAAADLPVDEIWEQARGLVEYSLEGEDTEKMDSALLRQLESPRDLSAKAVLLASAVHLDSDAPDTGLLMEALLPVLHDSDTAVAEAAAALLSNRAFRSNLDDDQQTRRLDGLLAGARDIDRQPSFRLACAMAAHKTGRGAEKRTARAEMLAFLDSSDIDLRRLGALSLARIGEPVRGRLERELRVLARTPGERGALAEAYLKYEDTKALQDRKFKDLLANFEDQVLPEDLQLLNSVLRMVELEHLDGDKFEREDLIHAAINGMLGALDRHSAFLSSDYFKQFNQDLEANYGGIGAYVDTDPADGLFTITRPIYSGPAYKAGLKSDDKIVRIDDWPTLGERREDIIKRLKGKPGTKVRLYIWRRGMDFGLTDRPTEDMVTVVERGYIEIPALAKQLLPGGIGLVDLREFSRVTSSELRDSIREMLDQGMRALVLDMRRNSGGLLTEAGNVSDLFLPKNLNVVSTESRAGVDQVLRTMSESEVPTDMPVVVLVGRFTASAAEIVSGALQDHNRAIIVGQRSFGKGSVQQLIPPQGTQDDIFQDENGNRRWDNWEKILRDWNNNGVFDFAPRVKLTIARYVLPSGRSIHREIDREGNVLSEGGVQPDVKVDVPRMEAWRVEERLRIDREKLARNYVDENWDEHRDLFRELAICDGEDPDRYPHFEEFMASLDTVLSRDDVRWTLRRELRRRVQDEQGGEFPGIDLRWALLGDFQDDVELQVAIGKALEGLGQEVSQIPEFAATFDNLDEEVDDLTAMLPNDDNLASTRAIVEQAIAGNGDLSREDLDRVLRALKGIDRN